MDGTDTPEIPRTPSIFPVTKEAVDNSLDDILKDPQNFVLSETALIDSLNPVFGSTLRGLGQIEGSRNRNSFITAVAYTHRVLREQTELNGSSIPKLSHDLVLGYIDEEIQENSLTRKGFSIDDFSEAEFKKLEEREPELARGIREISKYSLDKLVYYRTASRAYAILRKVIEGQELDRQTGMS